MAKLPRARFERLVLRAVEGLPPYLRHRLDNVDIVVERRPSAAQLRENGVPTGETLLGLYVGVPLTSRTVDYGLTLPDRIYIFQEPIERLCRTSKQLVDEVRATVIHELAHHFGIDDDRLDELGRG